MFRKKELIVRAVDSSDFDFLYKLENDKAYWHLSGTKKSFTSRELMDFIEGAQQPILLSRQFKYIIEIQGYGQIGCLDLFDYDPFNQHIGVGIIIYDENYRRKGYAKQALLLLESYLKEVLHCKYVFARVLQNNKASISLFNEINYIVADHQTKELFLQDKYYRDEILFQKKLK